LAGEVAVAYLHVISFIALAAFLVAEWLVLTSQPAAPEIRRLAWLDLAYLIVAIAVLTSGVLRVAWFGKTPSFYLHNPVFWIKLALFVAVALISIPPTQRFLRWRRALRTGAVLPGPAEFALVRRYVMAEVVILAFIPLAAVLAARGIGIQS
jgi:putative membrane protein